MSLINHFADGPDAWSLMKEIRDAKRVCRQVCKDLKTGKTEKAVGAVEELLKKLERAF